MTARFRPPPTAQMKAVAQPRMASASKPAAGHAPPPLPATARHFAPPPVAGTGGGTLRTGIVQGRFITTPRLAGGTGPGVAQARTAGDAPRNGGIPLPDTVRLPAGGGQPLPDGLRTQMETFFKTDFSSVRIHVGPQAPAIGALAFTTGSSIFFAPGQYQPATVQGRMLLGHELAHVVQQRSGRVRNPLGSGIAIVQDHVLEAEADRLGRQAAMTGPPPGAVGGRPVQAMMAPGRARAPYGGATIQRMQHDGRPYAPTRKEALVYYEVRDMRTQKGNPLNVNKVRGNLFEAVSKEELEAFGMFSTVYDANLIISNCPGIDYICVMPDDDFIFAQCKNHMNAQAYVTDILKKQKDAQLFVQKMVSRTLGGQLVAASASMRNFANTRNVAAIQNLLAQIDQYYGFNPNNNHGSSKNVDSDDDPVEAVARKILFPVPEDIFINIPTGLQTSCFIIERQSSEMSHMLDLMTYRQTRTSGQKAMDEEMDEYKPGNGY